MELQLHQLDLNFLSNIIFRNENDKLVAPVALAVGGGILCTGLFHERLVGVGLHPDFIKMESNGSSELGIRRLNIVLMEMSELYAVIEIQDDNIIYPFSICDFNKEIKNAEIQFYCSELFQNSN